MPTGPGEHLFAQIPFQAISAGVVTFDLQPSASPIWQIVIYGMSEEVPTAEIELVGTSINVIPEPAAFAFVAASLPPLALLHLRKGLSITRRSSP